MISVLLQVTAMALFVSAAVGFLLLLKGCYVLRRQGRKTARDFTSILLKSPQVPMVSVMAAPADASEQSRAFVHRLLKLHCSRSEVILVLNGPAEAEFRTWTEEFRLRATGRGTWESTDPLRLVVVKTEPCPCAEAYNSGLEAASGSLVAFVDPESEFVPEVLLRLALPLLENPEGVAAVCGVAPELASGSLIEQLAGLESLRLYLARCAAFAGWNMLLPVPGSCVLIRREAIRKAGGFPSSQDPRPGFSSPLALILQLHGQARRSGVPFRMTLVAEPVSRRKPPKSEADLRREILLEQRSLAGVMRDRKQIAGGLKAIGWGLPALLYWRLLRPLIETALYILALIAVLAGLVPVQVGILVLLCTVGAGILMSMSAVVLRELAEYRGSDPRQLTKLFFAAIPENLGYRQLRNLWLLEGFFR